MRQTGDHPAVGALISAHALALCGRARSLARWQPSKEDRSLENARAQCLSAEERDTSAVGLFLLGA